MIFREVNQQRLTEMRKSSTAASSRPPTGTRRNKVQPIRAPRVVQMPVRDWKMAAAGDYDDGAA